MSAADASSSPRSCGTCSLCCKVLIIDELGKPENVWCKNVGPQGGCEIYPTRPAACRSFLCNWLTDPGYGAAWKPEVCHFVMSSSTGGRGLRISVDTDAPDAWRREPYYAQIKAWSQATPAGLGYVAVFAGARSFVVFPEEDLAIPQIQPGSALKVGYVDTANSRQPVVAIAHADGSVKEFRGAIHAR